ncbi:elicitor-responsive protein 1 isoform X1 [Chenopodium quinoa]|uniref:elicitor-responsive protein 1 isoform X1 n=1 Tax=Chenopodium quinoa TaxID=63459 RepID=UPI000B778C44|nr:elicitor-responsive protein 1 isoform X1 [Chenopodium quinoa]
MTGGLLEVLVVAASGLPNVDFLTDKIDPYVVVKYKGQERKTKIARGQGGNPEWHQKLTFRAEYPGSGSDYHINLKIMDHDTFSSDDYIGETTIHVEDLLALGVENGSYEMNPTKFRVIGSNDKYCGEIKVGAKFTKASDYDDDEEFGGWKSSYGDDSDE